MENLMQREVCPPHRQPGVDTFYTDFLVTHPLMFAEATDPLEADNWLRILKSKFGLLHYTELQKTLFMAQQLRGPMSAWCANFTTLFRTTIRCHGPSSAQLFVGTTSLRA
jgi:hypothetical protein